MSFYEEMAAVALELLGPGDDTFGEQVTITRPAAGYDPVTRRKANGTDLVQVLWGTIDPGGKGQGDLAPVSQQGGLAPNFERLLTAVPTPGGFEPGVNDRVFGEGKNYQVMETAHIVKQGLPILWVCGLVTT